MKIVIAPDSFKESLTAEEVAQAIKRGFKKSIADVECLLCPVGDGGEGTVDAIQHSLELEEKWQEVKGPFGLNEGMRYFQKGQIALFEVADLVGLGKIPQEKRNPLHIQTRGIGELIRHLVDQGMKEIYIGVGGTASNDGGIGIAAGLGVEYVVPKVGHFLLEGRYYYGLGNIFGDRKKDYFSRSNIGNIVIKLTYLFDITKTKK